MQVGQSIWHCKRLGVDENDIIKYSEPKEYKLRFKYLTISPASDYLSTVQYGEKIDKIWKLKAIKEQFEGIFSEGDVLYIDGNKPDFENENYVYGDGANALITSVLPFLISYTITLERISP